MRTIGTIEELCNIEYGTRVVRKHEKGTEYPVYGGGGESFRINKFNRSDRLIISRFGMSLKCTRFVKGNFFLNDSGLTLSPKNKNLSQAYLDQIILSLNNKIFSLGKGSAQKNLSMNGFRLLKISYPSLEKQQKVVRKLKAAFSEIDNLISFSSDQIENAQTLIKLTLNSKIKNLPSSSYKKIGDVCSLVRGPFGGSLKKAIFVKKGFAIYEQAHPINDQCESFRYFITKEKFDEMRRFEVKPKDILMSCSGTLGRITIVPEDSPRGIINQALLKITPSDFLLSSYLQIIMRSDFFQKLIWEVSGGAAQTNVPSVKILKNIAIPIPSIEEQKIFINWKQALDKLKLDELYEQKTNLFIKLKESILLNEMES